MAHPGPRALRLRHPLFLAETLFGRKSRDVETRRLFLLEGNRYRISFSEGSQHPSLTAVRRLALALPSHRFNIFAM